MALDIRQPLNRFPLAQRRIRRRCFHPAGDFVAFEKTDFAQPLLARFDYFVKERPEHAAVVDRNLRLSYRELAARAVAITNAIEENEQRGPVALLFENSAAFVVASLGVLRARRVQLSLESTFPEKRLCYVLQQSQATTLLTNSANYALAKRLFGGRIQNIDELPSNPAPAYRDEIDEPDAPLVVDYTSGSTGAPKGMAWSQAGLLSVTARHSNVSHLCRHDRLIMFRASIRAYLSMLLNGGTFYPFDFNLEKTVDLGKWMAEQQITIFRAAVSTYRSLTSTLREEGAFPDLRLILLFGEPTYQRDLESYRRYFDHRCILGSSLGCNEMDDYAYYFADRSTCLSAGTIPGGYPVGDLEVTIRNDEGEAVADDELGEICVESDYKILGYWHRPDQKAGAFHRTGDVGKRDADGCLVHLGRKDSQIKIRGYRVDIGEVEASLLQVKGIKEAAVVSHLTRQGNQRLIAYLVPNQSDMPKSATLRATLRAQMPDYAIPSLFLRIDRVPMTATGKVDRRALPPADGVRPSLSNQQIGPRTQIESELVEVWGDVLEVRQIGVTDSFDELGGDSLHAAAITARVIDRFKVRPSLQAMLEASTIEAMALVVMKSQMETLEKSQLEQLLTEVEALSDEQIADGRPRGGERNGQARLALVVPFHNEDRHLPLLIHSLRDQTWQGIPVVFINSRSTDQSAAIVQSCAEVKEGKWMCLQEDKIGKVRAMRTATEFCRQEFGVSAVGFLDSDSYLGNRSWLDRGMRIVTEGAHRFGYTYSPITYFGFEKWPVFEAAYLAHTEVWNFLICEIGFPANGQGFICATEILTKYFREAETTTEVDLRCSLLALLEGREGLLNPGMLMSSGRRMVANGKNLAAWCFYDRDYYSAKDINKPRKLDLKVSSRIEDLSPHMVDRLFRRRSLKAVARHLLPLAIFADNDRYVQKIRDVLEVNGEPGKELAGFRKAKFLLTSRFEEMIIRIERDAFALKVADAIYQRACRVYERRQRSATTLSVK